MKKIALLLLILISFSLAAETKYISTIAAKSVIRELPEANSREVFTTDKYYPLKVLETRNSWYKVVDFEGTEGWIFKNIVSNDPCLVVKERAHVRTGAGLNYELYWEADKYSAYKLVESKKDWVKILDPKDNTSGWVYAPLMWGAQADIFNNVK